LPPLRSGHAGCKILLRILGSRFAATCGDGIPDDEPDLDWFNRPRNPSNPDPEGFDQRPPWTPPEVQLDDERILVLEST
jgi:hypothetical protein